jgi:hypothetical protein
MIKKLDKIESRSANYALLKAMEAFESSDRSPVGTCGNIKTQFEGELKLGPGKGFKYHGGIFGAEPFYKAVSASMLLSRLCAGFHGLKITVGGQSFYKTTWEVVLKHKESGNIVTFYDYKGAASFGSNVSKAEGQFKDDLEALLLALVDDSFPHPYDGCRVGEIA